MLNQVNINLMMNLLIFYVDRTKKMLILHFKIFIFNIKKM